MKNTAPFFNISLRKVGGLHFLKIGRMTFMFCVSRPTNVEFLIP